MLHAVNPAAAAAVSAAAAAAASGAAAAVAKFKYWSVGGALEPRSVCRARARASQGFSSRRRLVERDPARALANLSRRHSRASSLLSSLPHSSAEFCGTIYQSSRYLRVLASGSEGAPPRATRLR
jgi:hypothetical protein